MDVRLICERISQLHTGIERAHEDIERQRGVLEMQLMGDEDAKVSDTAEKRREDGGMAPAVLTSGPMKAPERTR